MHREATGWQTQRLSSHADAKQNSLALAAKWCSTPSVIMPPSAPLDTHREDANGSAAKGLRKAICAGEFCNVQHLHLHSAIAFGHVAQTALASILAGAAMPRRDTGRHAGQEARPKQMTFSATPACSAMRIDQLAEGCAHS